MIIKLFPNPNDPNYLNKEKNQARRISLRLAKSQKRKSEKREKFLIQFSVLSPGCKTTLLSAKGEKEES